MEAMKRHSLSDLMLPADYQRGRETVFPSEASVLWQLRQNRVAVVKAGAMVRLSGRCLINAPAMDRFMERLGAAAAKADLAKALQRRRAHPSVEPAQTTVLEPKAATAKARAKGRKRSAGGKVQSART